MLSLTCGAEETELEIELAYPRLCPSLPPIPGISLESTVQPQCRHGHPSLSPSPSLTLPVVLVFLCALCVMLMAPELVGVIALNNVCIF